MAVQAACSKLNNVNVWGGLTDSRGILKLYIQASY